MSQLTPQQIRDKQIVDKNGRNAGKVDGVEYTQTKNKVTINALLVGSAVWLKRLPDWLSEFLKIFIKQPSFRRISMKDVRVINASVHLKKTAEDLGLGKGDDQAQKWLEKIPGT